MVNETAHRNPVEVLAEEFLHRQRRGESVTIGQYVKNHPDLADEIRSLFPAMMAMERFKAARFSSSGRKVEWHLDAPEQLGDYRIIREIGRGGMGVVYEAEQQSLGRRVAVKVFPQQTLRDSKHLNRFYKEARTAAALHHTNIVQIFGVGEQEGLHYYVMQRIQGRTLDDAIRERRQALNLPNRHQAFTKPLATITPEAAPVQSSHTETNVLQTTEFPVLMPDSEQADSGVQTPVPTLPRGRRRWRDVAEIGIQVAEALSYAHAHGVLHRDIKPSNLLLDDQGTVWVADFGLATMLEPDHQDTHSDVAGTLRFMAPEYLRGEQDTRSDIYSLGATLYELLTLQPAIEDEKRSRMIHRIQNGDVTPIRNLIPDLSRDLEAIVSKSMAPDPLDRYSEASDLADDLRRYLANRPVTARWIGPIGRLWRWTGRNPIIATLSTALLLTVICSFVLISSKWREAVVESRRAESNLSVALESLDQILERFGSSWMAHPMAADSDAVAPAMEYQVAVSDHSAAVLKDALRFYDRFADHNTLTPRLISDTAKVHHRVGDIYERLGQYSKAEAAYSRALAILNSSAMAANETHLLETAQIMNRRGTTMYAVGRFGEAATEFRSVQELLTTSASEHNPEFEAELARSHNHLGQALQLMGQHEAARESHRKAVSLLEHLVSRHSDSVDYRLALAQAYRVYYPFAAFDRRRGNGQRIRSAGISLLEHLVEEFPEVPDYQCELAEMLMTTSSFGFRQRNRPQQVEQLERAEVVSGRLAVAHPTISRYRATHARILKELGGQLTSIDRDLADQRLRDSVVEYRSLTESFSDVPVYHLMFAFTLLDYCRNLQQLGRIDDAYAALQEGFVEQRSYASLRPESPFVHHIGNQLNSEQEKIDQLMNRSHDNPAADSPVPAESTDEMPEVSERTQP